MKKRRRGKRNRAKHISKSLRFLGVNSAGLKQKLSTFKKVIKELEPSVFFIEESKFREEGKFKIDNYIIFELVRESRDGGGGLALGCVKELKPVLARKGNDDIEAMSVDIFVQRMQIRCVVGYGCQETSLLEKKHAFWNYIEEEVISAWNSGSGFILQFDGNLWAGSDIIPGDPRVQNKNGKLFQEFLASQPNLTVVNSLSICEGLITRSRVKGGKEEKSVLDFFVVCSRVLPHVTKMVIDENKKHILTNYKPARKGEKAKDSDHFTEYMDLNLQLIPLKPERKEIFNFKDGDALSTFKDITSNTDKFSKCFEDNQDILKQVDKWRKTLKSHCQIAFKKIRINNKKHVKPLNPKHSALVDLRNKLVNKSANEEDAKKVKEIEESIADIEAEENKNLVMKHLKKISDIPESPE